MTLQELYAVAGGDFEGVERRLRGEGCVRRFVGMFVGDESYSQLQRAMACQDWQAAFAAAHTLKGVAFNMGFNNLAMSTSVLVEQLREGGGPTDEAPYREVCSDYACLVDAIEALD